MGLNSTCEMTFSIHHIIVTDTMSTEVIRTFHKLIETCETKPCWNSITIQQCNQIAVFFKLENGYIAVLDGCCSLPKNSQIGIELQKWSWLKSASFILDMLLIKMIKRHKSLLIIITIIQTFMYVLSLLVTVTKHLAQVTTHINL